MKTLTGELGKFTLDNEQVGGFKYWTVIISQNPLQTFVKAQIFWMLKTVSTNELNARFCFDSMGKTKIVYEGKVKVKLPDKYELDKYIKQPITMELPEGFDWLHENYQRV